MITSNGKRNFAIICAIVIAISQIWFVIPSLSFAEKAGDELIVRVQYSGDRDDKIRTIATFSRSELEKMSAGTYKYATITDVGTVMHSIGKGPRVTDVIKASGIDVKDVDCVYFRTSDGAGTDKRYTTRFSMASLSLYKTYYPMLPYKYKRTDDEAIIPLDGALANAESVPTILATECFSTKLKGENVYTSDLSTKLTYRLLGGQTKLRENTKSKMGDVSAIESVHSIFGMDIVLDGYPPITGISLNAVNKNLSVGSSSQIHATVIGGSPKASNDLKWSSSDESVVFVTDSGFMTIYGEGTATISAEAPNGLKATMKVTVSGKKVQKEIANPDYDPNADYGEGEEAPSPTIIVEEIEYSVDITYSDAVEKADVINSNKKVKSISNKHTAEDIQKSKAKEQAKSAATIKGKQVNLTAIENSNPQKEVMTNNQQALEAAEQYGPKTKAIAGGIGAGILAAGAALRIRRFRIER